MIPLPRAILFDWDNTLVDTWPTIHEALNHTLAVMEQPLWSVDQTRARVRRSLRDYFPNLFGARWEEAQTVFYAKFGAIHLARLEICPGAEELLSTVHRAGLYLGVVSNKSGPNLRREAEHLRWTQYFGRLVGATDAAADKPAPEPVLLALEGSGVPAGKDVWIVGDTWIDLDCAYNAHCVPVLVRADPPRDGEFGATPPVHHFPDLGKICALVEKR